MFHQCYIQIKELLLVFIDYGRNISTPLIKYNICLRITFWNDLTMSVRPSAWLGIWVNLVKKKKNTRGIVEKFIRKFCLHKGFQYTETKFLPRPFKKNQILSVSHNFNRFSELFVCQSIHFYICLGLEAYVKKIENTNNI